MNRWKVFSLLGVIWLIFSGCSVKNASVTTQPNSLAKQTNTALLVFIKEQQLWLSDADGKTVKQLPTVGQAVVGVAWFHDKNKLLYCTQVNDYYEFWKLDLTSNQAEFVYAIHNKPAHIAMAPNDQAMLFFEQNNLYLLNLATKTNLRLHEGAKFASWSPNNKQIVFNTTDDRLLLQQLGVNPKLDTPLVLLNEAVNVPIFLDERTIAYEGRLNDEYTILNMDLTTLQSQAITSLRFGTTQAALDLQLEPNQERLLYVRPDDTTGSPAVWIFHRNKDAPKLILTKAYPVVWSGEDNVLYYIATGDGALSAWRSTTSGLNKTKLFNEASAIITSRQNISL